MPNIPRPVPRRTISDRRGGSALQPGCKCPISRRLQPYARNRTVNFMAGASEAATSAAQLQAAAEGGSGLRDLKVAKHIPAI